MTRYEDPKREDLAHLEEFVNYADNRKASEQKRYVEPYDPDSKMNSNSPLLSPIGKGKMKTTFDKEKKKWRSSQFSSFSKLFQFGQACAKFEAEKHTIKREWDQKVPKQPVWAKRKFDIPLAPLPDHLKTAPRIQVSTEDSRKIKNSRLTTEN